MNRVSRKPLDGIGAGDEADMAALQITLLVARADLLDQGLGRSGHDVIVLGDRVQDRHLISKYRLSARRPTS
jgi:hypothetical protein